MQLHPKRSLRVFLCHAVQDNTAADALYRCLEDDGVAAWLDSKSLLPGNDIELAISSAIRDSDIVLICLSKSSVVSSGHFNKEIKQALDFVAEMPEGTAYVIPVKFEECPLPSQLERFYHVALDFNGRSFSHSGYSKLLAALADRAQKVNAIFLPKVKSVELPLDFLYLPQEERIIIEICSFLRTIDPTILQRLLVEIDNGKYGVLKSSDCEQLLRGWEERGLFERIRHGWKLRPELCLMIKYYLDNDKKLAIKVNMVLIAFYNFRFNKSIDDRAQLIVDELYHSAVLNILGVNGDVFDVLDKRLAQYRSMLIDNWQDIIEQISGSIRNDKELRDLIGNESFELLIELVEHNV